MLATIGGIILIGIMLFMCADVFMRVFFNNPFPGSVEICALAIVYVIYFGLAHALISGAHVRVTLIFSHFPKRLKRGCMLTTYGIATLFFGFATWRSWIYFWQSFVRKEFMFASIDIPWYLGKFAVPVGVFFICITCLLYFVLTLVGRKEGA
jgi:TRAP-type transport system small permease protein